MIKNYRQSKCKFLAYIIHPKSCPLLLISVTLLRWQFPWLRKYKLIFIESKVKYKQVLILCCFEWFLSWHKKWKLACTINRTKGEQRYIVHPHLHAGPQEQQNLYFSKQLILASIQMWVSQLVRWSCTLNDVQMLF